MLQRAVWLMMVAAVLILTVPDTAAADVNATASLDSMVGKSVDIAPWTHVWRADRAVQETPEAYFIPRRLERLDRVYRTAFDSLSAQDLKSLYYDQPDLLKPLLPKPKGSLLAGLLWTGSIADCQVTLDWPAGSAPTPESIEVRVYPTSWGWFGWTVDRVLSPPDISADGRSWTYRITPGLQMDYAYSRHVDAATEMVAVFGEGAASGIPEIHVTSPRLGAWQRMDLEIEWGFTPETEASVFDGSLETHVAMIGPVRPLPGDSGTVIRDGEFWHSQAIKKERRGIQIGRASCRERV